MCFSAGQVRSRKWPKDAGHEVTEEPNGLWKSRSVKKRKLALLTDCFTREFPSLNLQAGGEQGEEMADDGDLGLAFQNSGSGEGLSEEEADWNQGCSTEDWSASSKLLHIYRHNKKSFQILRNGVQKPKRLAIKQLVDQHPLQSFKMMNIRPDEASRVPGPNAELIKYPASFTSADPITSNSGKFMSLQELEERIFAKKQGHPWGKELKAPQPRVPDDSESKSERRMVDLYPDLPVVKSKETEIVAGSLGTWTRNDPSELRTSEPTCIEQLQEEEGVVPKTWEEKGENEFRLTQTRISEDPKCKKRDQGMCGVAVIDMCPKSVGSDIVEGSLWIELDIPKLRIASPPCTNQQGSQLIEDSEADKDMGAETLMMADFDQPNHTWELSSHRIGKVKESTEMTLQIETLTKAIWSFNLQKEKLCKWKEFELGAVSPTSLIGQSCKVFWPLDNEWYTGVVGDYNDHTRKHLITYEDSEEEWIILARERVKLKVSAAQRLRLSIATAQQSRDRRERPNPDELAALAVSMEVFEDEPGQGDLVWAKVKGYPMWPAIAMDEEHARACGMEPTSRDSVIAVQFFGSYDHARVDSKNVVLFSKGLLSKYHCKCKRVAFHQGLQEVEVYLKECKLPESMAHIQVDSPGVPGTSGCIDRQRQEVEGDDHDFVGDERKCVIRKSVNSLFTLPLKLGTLVVLSLGQIVRDSEHFHDQHHIWTEGYTAVRKFAIMKEADVAAVEYKMEVLRNPGMRIIPLFRVTPNNEMPIDGNSPSACWKKILLKLQKAEEKTGRFLSPEQEKRRRIRSGAAMFGFSNPRVSELIQGLPHARMCFKYRGWSDKSPLPPGEVDEDLLPAGYRPVEVQWKHLDRCTVCYLDVEYVDNLLLQCDKCRIIVHMNCYGVLEPPDGKLWLCSLCGADAPKQRPLCCLCPITSGAMKRTTDGRWAHLTCALWMPELSMVDNKRMEPVDGINAIHKERWNLTCSVCRVPYGACIQCADSHCRVAYHPLCARASSLRMEAIEERRRANGETSLRLISYCRKHRRPAKAQHLNNTASQARLACSAYEPVANASGCARTEPYDAARRRGRREPEALAAALVKRLFVENLPVMVTGCCQKVPEGKEKFKVWSWNLESIKSGSSSTVTTLLDAQRAQQSDDVVLSVSEKFENMRTSMYRRLTFGKSAIHGWGVFTKQIHHANDMVIEYAGEVVRPIVADIREARCYDSLVGAGTYMFRVDDERVVDATHSGSLAHLINHSCEPNCYSRLVAARGKDRIIIFAKRDIAPGEELTYDYRFMSKDEQLICCCGSPSCRGSVNILDDDTEPSTTLFLPLSDLTKLELSSPNQSKQ